MDIARYGVEPAASVRTSIVILTYARDAVLLQVLDAFRPFVMGRDDYEVVLVDNNADAVDRGALLTGFHAAQWLRMGANRGVIARNDGMAAARGEFLAVLDDDVFIQTPDFLDRIATLFEADPAVGCLTIRKLLHETGETRVDLIPHTRKDLDLTRPFMTFRFVGGLVIFRRTVFDQVGGFSTEFFYGLEEIEYAYRLVSGGWRIRYSPEIVAIELEHPGGRMPNTEVQTIRLTNKYIMSWIHMPFPQIVLNYLFFAPYIFARQRGQVRVGRAMAAFVAWLRRPDRTRRHPIGPAALAYIRGCGGSTWR